MHNLLLAIYFMNDLTFKKCIITPYYAAYEM